MNLCLRLIESHRGHLFCMPYSSVIMTRAHDGKWLRLRLIKITSDYLCVSRKSGCIAPTSPGLNLIYRAKWITRHLDVPGGTSWKGGGYSVCRDPISMKSIPLFVLGFCQRDPCAALVLCTTHHLDNVGRVRNSLGLHNASA